MNRPANSKVRHGMASCGRYGCDRPECRKANHRSQEESRRAVRAGIRATVSAEEAAAHGRALTGAGMFILDIAKKAGLDRDTVNAVISGRKATIYRDTADAILGVPMPDENYKPECNGRVDATAARRRLKALGARGFTLPALGRECGIGKETVAAIRSGRYQFIRVSIDQAVEAAYNRLWKANPLEYGVLPGEASKARAWARKQEWAPAAAWDEDEIGDPKAKPKGYRKVDGRKVWDLAV